MEILSATKVISCKESDHYNIVFISGERVTIFADGLWIYENTIKMVDTWIFGTWGISEAPSSSQTIPKVVKQVVKSYGRLLINH